MGAIIRKLYTVLAITNCLDGQRVDLIHENSEILFSKQSIVPKTHKVEQCVVPQALRHDRWTKATNKMEAD